MDYYYKEFDKLNEELHEVMHDYPLFSEDIKELEEHEIKEINELLDKHDDFYFKKAIDKLKDLISYIKDISENIQKEYHTFDKLANVWEKVIIKDVTKEELDAINDEVKRANALIASHDIKNLREANKIMETLIKNNSTK